MEAERMGRFAIVPATVFDDPDLTAHTRDVLVLISTYANKEGWCWPAQETLARILRIARPTLNGYLKELERKGYLEIHRQGGRGCRYRLLYDRAMQPQLDVGQADIRSRPDRQQESAPPTQNRPSNRPSNKPPAGWMPSAEDIEWASLSAPGVDLAREGIKFLNYYEAKPSKSPVHDWGKLWRNWIYGAVERQAGRGGGAGAGGRVGSESTAERHSKLNRALRD